MKFIDTRNWIEKNGTAQRPYYFQLYSGQIGESDTPIGLFDLLCDPAYSDCDDRTTQIIMLGRLLRDVAGQTLAAESVHARVYSGSGPFFDNRISRHPDEIEEEGSIEFYNENEPVLLDFWDEWTTMASLVKCGYLNLYERIPTFSVQADDITAETDLRGPFPVSPSAGELADYIKVDPEKLQEPIWKPHYVKIEDRTEEYKYYRTSPTRR
ncbi:hypothetical protein ACFQZE_23720 [Paenibacillus sp. GCM10027627]|uniref:hypothetical protein n=1 Tax=unclassified Paenibacillus TaxID=185978 RepID=UPI0036253AC1